VERPGEEKIFDITI